MKKKIRILIVAAILFSGVACKAQDSSSNFYYEITTTSHTTQMDVSNYTKVFIAPSGDMRQETQATLPLMGKIDAITLSSKNDPSHITVINEKTKVYAVSTVPPNPDTVKEDMTKVVIINDGKVIVNGFPSTALIIIDKGDNAKLWISDAVPGNKESINILSTVMGMNPKDNFIKLIREKGYKGSWVKFASGRISESPDAVEMVMELTKAKYAAVSESLMKLPAGYTETKGDPFAMHVHNETKINEQFKAKGKIGK